MHLDLEILRVINAPREASRFSLNLPPRPSRSPSRLVSRPRRALSPPSAVGPAAATTTAAGPGPAAAAVAAPAAADHVVATTVDVLRPPPAVIALREDLEAEGFGDKDPRRFNFQRAWSSGDDDVVAVTDADNWRIQVVS